MRWKNIREIFWPLLEKNNISSTVEGDTVNIPTDQIDNAIELSFKVYDAELSRVSTVETKASIFIGTLAIITSVAIAITTSLINEKYSLSRLILLSLLFILIMYILRTVWFAVKVHERKPFHMLFINDIYVIVDKQKFFHAINKKIKMNLTVINSKVDNMTMAQEYFKRAIVTLGLYTFSLILYFLKKSIIPFIKQTADLFREFNSLRLSTWLVCLLILISTISILINFYLLFLKKKQTENPIND